MTKGLCFRLYKLHFKCWLLSISGSIVKASEKCITSVQGGRAEYTAALAWEKRGVLPDSTTYQNWIKSTIDNPTVIDYKVRMRNKHLCHLNIFIY